MVFLVQVEAAQRALPVFTQPGAATTGCVKLVCKFAKPLIFNPHAGAIVDCNVENSDGMIAPSCYCDTCLSGFYPTSGGSVCSPCSVLLYLAIHS